MFTWVPIYKELSEKVIALKNSPESLVRIVKDIEKEGLKVIPFLDKLEDGSRKELSSMDPFTFYSMCNR